MQKVLSLFDLTGNMVRPWAEAGHTCFIVDTQHELEGIIETFPSGGSIRALNLDLSDPEVCTYLADLVRPDIIFSFPPCTDLAVSGARHFKAKAERDPAFQSKATELAMSAYYVAINTIDLTGHYPAWFAENPVSVLSTLWRKPDHAFNPCDYGGYLSPSEYEHPQYPDVIPARDAYTKRTCLWTGGDFKMPAPMPVEPETAGVGETTPLHAKLGGKSMRTKNIRSATPRGFAKAVYLANVRGEQVTIDEALAA
jgi:hypothetical protein